MRATHRSSRRAARRRRQRAVVLGCAALLVALGAGGYAVLAPGSSRTASEGPTAQARVVPPLTGSSAEPSVEPTVEPSVEPTVEPSTAPPSSAAPPTVVEHGDGSFTAATATGGRVGTGSVLRRYRVEVEDGTGIDPNAAAAAVQAVLSDPRSWTTDGRDSFQLVSSGSYDFTVKIASPDTADAICATGGLDTRGEVNCDVGKQVVVNSKRWLTGSPQFDGSLDDYRALIVNHEVGHRIGHGHETCPGPGKPAPAMMQQIYGLKGCTANAWPYDANGTYLRGPSVP